MKTAKSLLIKLFVAAAMLLLTQQSHALTTPYLIALSNDVAAYHGVLSASPLPEHQREARALARVLRDLRPATTTVAQDYTRFFLAVLHLGNYAYSDSSLTDAGVAVFQQFMGDAGAKIGELSARTNALNKFVRTRSAASRQIDQALALLIINATETNLQTGLIRGGLIFSTLVAAERLVVRGEASQGFAPEDGTVAGGIFNYNGRNESGTTTLTDASNYTDANLEETVGGTYLYTRTGLNTATLVLSETGGGVTTLRVTFRADSEGGYAFTFVDGEDRGRGAGRFTYTPPPPVG